MKNAMRNEERELARRLAPEAVEPPEGLLERLKADIPEELPEIDRDGSRREDRDDGDSGRVLRFPGALAGLSSGVVLKAAAAVVLAVGAGFLALQVQRETPDLQVQEAAQGAEEAVSAPVLEEPRPPAGAQEPIGEDEAIRQQAPREPRDVGRDVGRFSRVPATRSQEGLEQRKEELFDRLQSLRRQRTQGGASPPPAEDPPVTEKPRRPSRSVPPPPRPVPEPEPKVAEKAAPKRTDPLESLGYLSYEEQQRAMNVDVSELGGTAYDAVAPEASADTQAAVELPESEPTAPPEKLAHLIRDLEIEALVDTAYDALSTFGLDVDTGSYGLVRRHLMEGVLPPAGTVRIEELLNAFDYGDPAPTRGDFAVTAQGAPSPFRPGLHLLRLGIKAREVRAEERKPAALTFVVDVSGSMQQPGKLDLAKQALGLLLDQLEAGDTVALVSYGSEARTVLAHTADKEAVRRALDALRDGGSTNAEAGLRLGYEEARRAFRPGAVNRVVLCSDGVANVGATDPQALLERVGEEARDGIELTTLGFGMGTYNDHLMEQLADRGDGRYAYLDDLIEAHRVLVEELTGTVQTVARDARVQFELNPGTVQRYRLLGYENRDIADHRFRYDDQDAGEIGSGHAVTVLYELELKPSVPDTASLGVLRLRWWSVAEDRFVEIEEPVYRRDLVADWDRAAPALRWAALTARFAQALRDHAPKAELPDLADRMHRLTNRAWPVDDRRAELADLTRHAAEVHRDLLQRAVAAEPAEDPQEP